MAKNTNPSGSTPFLSFFPAASMDRVVHAIPDPFLLSKKETVFTCIDQALIAYQLNMRLKHILEQ